jgi:hypothetical protein
MKLGETYASWQGRVRFNIVIEVIIFGMVGICLGL